MSIKLLQKYMPLWREVTLIFVLSRIGIALVTVITIALFSRFSPLAYVPDLVAAHYQAHDLWGYLYAWWRWDAVHLTKIAAYGYQNNEGYRAFLPLSPFLQRAIGDILSLIVHPKSAFSREALFYFAGVILANACTYITMLLCYVLVKKEKGAWAARLTLLFLVVYPYSMFLFAGYSEPLFFLLAVAVFFFLQRNRWWLAAFCATLLMLTRVAGALIVIPFLVLYIQRFWPQWRERVFPWRAMVRRALPVAIIPLGLGIYMLYLYHIWHNPFIFQAAEAAWNRHASVPGYGLYLDLKVLTNIKHLWPDLRYSDIMDAVFSIGPLAALLIGWKRLPLHYWLFSLAMVLFSMCTYGTGTDVMYANPALSYPRYVMAAFPMFLLYAEWSEMQPLTLVLLVPCFLILQIVNIALFVTGHWVA
jgi:hypothetical protein